MSAVCVDVKNAHIERAAQYDHNPEPIRLGFHAKGQS